MWKYIWNGRDCIERIDRCDKCVVKWLVRLFNACCEKGDVPKEWQKACIMPLRVKASTHERFFAAGVSVNLRQREKMARSLPGA